MGRAPRTKETLPDFREKCQVTRHSRVFRGLTGSQRTPKFWGVTNLVELSLFVQKEASFEQFLLHLPYAFYLSLFPSKKIQSFLLFKSNILFSSNLVELSLFSSSSQALFFVLFFSNSIFLYLVSNLIFHYEFTKYSLRLRLLPEKY